MSAKETVVRSTCGLCRHYCDILVHLVDGKAISIEGDPESPLNRGKLCKKGLASIELLYSPDRLQHPMKRLGERGEGKWELISWDEALNIVAEAFKEAKETYGAESVLLARGAARGPRDDFFTRFGNAFGTPNVYAPSAVCFVPMLQALALTYGTPRMPRGDYEHPPASILIWGANSQATSSPEYWDTLEALEKGSKLIVIDPICIDLAARKDCLWIQPRPSSDLALALGMINVIINENLWDKDFVDKWTVGFNELCAHIRDYSPENVAEITWVEAKTIREAARFYATNKPACIQWGNGLEHNINSFQMCRAIWILTAITGNYGVPGGNILFKSPGLIRKGADEFILKGNISESMRKFGISAEDGLVPTVTHLLTGSIVKSILDEDPYPIRVAYFQGCNALLNFTNAQETFKALKKLDFIVVADMFMTPTAALADVVLPAASYLEFDSVSASNLVPIARAQRKVAQIGECWSDIKILNILAKTIGMEEYYWQDEEQGLDAMLKPLGMTFRELQGKGMIKYTPDYKNYEKSGFGTPSGKVELYSKRLKDWGFDPLPVYHEPSETPYSDPELAKQFPLIFTSSKCDPYQHSAGRQIPILRAFQPEPVVYINPETARKLQIQDGDRVFIETKRGRITQKAKLSASIDPRVIFVDYAWWFPERDPSTLYDWAKSNINVLTDNKPPYNPEMGTSNLRGICCKVHKA